MVNSYEPYDPNEDFPTVRNELVEALEARFPNQCPSIGTSDREIWAALGRWQVVAFLKDMNLRGLKQ
jgi:hypothetical protein